jgi:enediyne biosynthesis protein E11
MLLDQQKLITDLTDECAELDALVAGLNPADWSLPTPAEGWTVAHQIAHLSFVFGLAGLAAGRPAAFKQVAEQAGSGAGFDAAVNAALVNYPLDDPAALLDQWRKERAGCITTLSSLPGEAIVPWLVRPIPARVLCCAGLMELFGHGQDIADALGVRREHTDRIGPLSWFITQTWDFGYHARQEETPATGFRYQLTAPSGAHWEFGPDDATETITGPAEDFCLLATRRRHRDDLAVSATGPNAEHWLDIAQSYRGSPGPGRKPGQFAALPR